MAIDSKLRGCDLVKLSVSDISYSSRARDAKKTLRRGQLEITEATRDSLSKWIKLANIKNSDFIFPSRIHNSPHITTLQYVRIVHH